MHLDVLALAALPSRLMPSPPNVPALAPAEQTACYSPWLKVRVLIRAALTQPWAPETWPEVRAHLPWLLAKERRLRREGWLS